MSLDEIDESADKNIPQIPRFSNFHFINTCIFDINFHRQFETNVFARAKLGRFCSSCGLQKFSERRATMMKKAASLSKRGPRRKQTPRNGPAPAANEESANNDFEIDTPQPPPIEMQQNHHYHRRKPSAEEAALTSKNYRLAKELVSRYVRIPAFDCSDRLVPYLVCLTVTLT